MPSWPIIGAMLNSALYLSAVFIASIVDNNSIAMKTAVAAFGFTYLGYLAATRIQWDSGWSFWVIISNIIVAISIALGVAAGLALLPIW